MSKLRRNLTIQHAQMAVTLDNHWRSLNGLIHDAQRYEAGVDVLNELYKAREHTDKAVQLLLLAEVDS